MLKLLFLDGPDVRDPVKLAAFQDALNDCEAKAQECGLICSVNAGTSQDGSILASVQYALVDLQSRQMRPATVKEAEKRLARLTRGLSS